MKHEPVEEQARAINQILRGHFNYYGLAGNAREAPALLGLHLAGVETLSPTRSQTARLTWEAFKALLDKHPLVRPRIRIPYSQLASYARL